MTDRHTAGECVSDGPGSAGGAPLAGRHPAGVQEPEQEARRVVSLMSCVLCLSFCNPILLFQPLQLRGSF